MFLTASVAAYPPGYETAVVIQQYQFVEGVGLVRGEYFIFNFTVGSNGTGKFSMLVANEADRPDRSNDVYVDGVQMFDPIIPFAC